jgi:hypothetical protein
MTSLRYVSLIALSAAFGGAPALAQTAPAAPAAEEMPGPAVEKYARDFLAKWSGDANLIAAIKASTQKTKSYSFDDVTILDSQWRVAKSGPEKEKKAAETLNELTKVKLEENVKKGEAIIKEARENDISKFLKAQIDSAEPKGAVVEIFVMDGWGWNVGQTGGTSDFYQGDEGKWQKTFAGADPKEVEVLPIVEEDGIRQAQISLPIKDGDKNIGAVTIGIDVTKVN